MKFPDFIIAGFGRCGTSAILLNLGQHPDIQIALRPGTEIKFWGTPDFKDNIDQYKNRFNGKICGEKSPGYILHRKIIENIIGYIPNVKIILCMRNPVYRAVSHVELHKRWGRVKQDKQINMTEFGKVHREGQYIIYIKQHILPFFPKENVYYNIMEWSKENFDEHISKIHNFLGADPRKTEIENTFIEDKFNNESPYTQLFTDNKNHHVWTHSYYTEPTEDYLIKAHKYFEPFNDELFEFLGYDIPEWRM